MDDRPLEEGDVLGELFVRPTVASLLKGYSDFEVVDTDALLFEFGVMTDSEEIYEDTPFEVPRGHIGILEVNRTITWFPNDENIPETYDGEELDPGVYRIKEDLLTQLEALSEEEDSD